jgi:hypothetical protein
MPAAPAANSGCSGEKLNVIALAYAGSDSLCPQYRPTS